MVLKMKDTNSACLSAVPHVPHLAKFLMPFYKCWAGAGWQQCKRPFLTQGVGRWFQRYWFFWKWGLPWLCLISAFQTPTSYKWNDTCPFAFYAVNRVLRFGFWQSEFGFQIVKVPVFRHNNLLQNPTYCKIQLIAKFNLLHLTPSSRAGRRVCALRALGLLLADGAPTVGRGKTFWRVN